MKKKFTLMAAAVLSAGLFFAGWPSLAVSAETEGTGALDLSGSDFDYERLKDQNITLNVANWGEYMSLNSEEGLDVNKEFERLTGISVNYKTCATNEELYAKLKSGGADYDVIIPSDYMISRMIGEEMIQPLNFDNIPNAKLINSRFLNPAYDSTNEYSVPYMWGIVCLIYNTTMIPDEIDSWESLWNPAYQNQILMFDNPRDAFGIALLKNGYSLNTEDKDQLKKAQEDLKAQKAVVQAYVMDEIFDKLEGGSAAIAPYYAGDAVTMMSENPDLSYAIPKEGTNQFVDAACIPTVAKNKEAAEIYINFLNEPEVAAANAEYIGYSTPNDGAFALLDEETQNNPLQYPDAEYLNTKTEFFVNLSSGTNDYLQALWTEFKGTSQTAAVWLIPVLLVLAIAATIFISIRRARKKKQDIF